MRRQLLLPALIALTLLCLPARAEQYLTQEQFLQLAFADATPHAAQLWLDADTKKKTREILGHDYRALRVRYWQLADKTAWILDEIGKEQPITLGVVIKSSRIESLRVLAFRESRGWEIRHAFFTGQFAGSTLTPTLQLDKRIDGITGATLSVRAATNVSRLALYFHQHVNSATGNTHVATPAQ